MPSITLLRLVGHTLFSLFVLLVFAPLLGSAQQYAGSAGGYIPPLNCPEDAMWRSFYEEVNRGAAAFNNGDFAGAKSIVAAAVVRVTADEKLAFACSLGIASAYRALAFAYSADARLSGRALQRANQIGLRFLHTAMNWITHTFVSTNHDAAFIDGSAWPITLQQINEDLTAVTNAVSSWGPVGHKPTAVVPHDFKRQDLKIVIVSVCAYPPDHVLPRYATSNHQLYAEMHGYDYRVAREVLDPVRKPAWGKIRFLEQHIREGRWDWVMWADCDYYFMNMSSTIDSLLFTYGAEPEGKSDGVLELDKEFHLLVAEDNAMLNTGAFFMRSSPQMLELLEDVWGPDDSPWADHPWWENAAFAWHFLKDNAAQFAGVDPFSWSTEQGDLLDGIYPSYVRLAPQWTFNSYHPITSRFMHDTWEEGKFGIAFNGVLSASSPTVIKALYGNYYRTSCRLNNLEERCVKVEEVLPWARP